MPNKYLYICILINCCLSVFSFMSVEDDLSGAIDELGTTPTPQNRLLGMNGPTKGMDIIFSF